MAEAVKIKFHEDSAHWDGSPKIHATIRVCGERATFCGGLSFESEDDDVANWKDCPDSKITCPACLSIYSGLSKLKWK